MMKNLLKFSMFSFLVLSFALVANSTFAEATIPASPTPVQTNIPIATINIQGVQILSQKGNVFNISFNINNREGLQTGVKYGVQLMSESKTSKTVVDQKVYDESLTIYPNSTTQKEITYTAPAELNGPYTLFLTSSNTSGFLFSVALAGKVTLSSSVKGFEIVTSSCYLKVEGDKSNTHYGLLQGVDLGEDESLRLSCNTINHTSNVLSLIPSFETRYRSVYGEVALAEGGEVAPIAFAANKNENFSVLLPKGTMPQLYDVKVVLSNEQIASNALDLHYFIRGPIASIRNLNLDKDSYKMGDVANISLIWIRSGDKFLRGNSTTDTATAPITSMTADIVDGKGRECAETLHQILVREPGKAVTDVPISITRSCSDPKVTVAITDGSGNVLDQKSFAFETGKSSKTAIPMKQLVSIIIVLILIIIIGVYMKKKNGTGGVSTMKVFLPFLLLLAIGGMIPTHKAMADVYPAGSTGLLDVTVTIDNNAYAPGGTITVTSSIVSNDPISQFVHVKALTVGNATITIIPDQTINGGGNIPISSNFFATPGAPTTPGTGYLVDFWTGVFDDEEPIPIGMCINDFAFSGSFRFGQVHYYGPAQHPPVTVNVTLVGWAYPPPASTNGGPRTSVFTFPSNSNHSFSNGMDCYGNYGCEIEGTGGFDHGYVASISPSGSCPPPPAQVYYNNCFVADTLVALSDGSKKNIQDIQIGDVLKGETTNNKVLGFHRPKLDGKVYSFNGGRYFVTEEHPFKTTDGWKSINPSKTAKENIGITVTELKVGDTLITDSGTTKLNSIDGKYESEATPLYNFLLDGDHTYFADGYLVHNKQECHDDGNGDITSCAGGGIPCIDYQGYAYAVTPYTGTCAIGCNVNGTNYPFCQGAGGYYCPGPGGQC